MSSSAPGGSFGRVFGLHGNGSAGNRDGKVVGDEDEDEEEEEAMVAASVFNSLWLNPL